MSFKARAYLFIVIAGGCAALLVHGLTFHPADPFRFAAYLVLAMIASSMKVRLPGVTGTMSVLFLFILIGIIELSLAETLTIGVAAVFVQSFWKPKQFPKPIHVAFNVTSLLLAIEGAHLAYTLPLVAGISTPFPVRLAAAAFTFFIGNTLTISVIIALTENRSVLDTWRTCYFWAFPYYIVGACLAGLFGSLSDVAGWQTSVLFLPIVYLIYRSYLLYLDRLEQGRVYAEKLEAAANRLNAVLESTSDLVIAVNAAGKITYANQRAKARLFGGSDAADAVLWTMFPKLASGRLPAEVSRVLATNAPASLEEEFFPELNASFEVHAYPSADGVAIYLKDVTEERQLAEQLRQAQKMEAIGRLAGGVAHDFNNLLTIILGYGQVLGDALAKGSFEHTAATEILKAADRAAALTQRLLAFSRKQVLQPIVLDLNSVVTGFESMLRRLIGEDIRISVQLDPTIGKVKADPNQMEQVVMNLAVNARDAMPDGGELTVGTSTIQLEPAQARHHDVAPGCYVMLSVSDTGVGMDAGTRERIFEPFFTTKDPGKGTGLGLSTVYGIVQQSGGYLTVQSEPGHGATFNIYLPCVSGEAEILPSTGTEQLQSAGGTILLVEDEEPLKELAEQMLTKAGYTVTAVTSTDDALRLSGTDLKSFELLVTDVVMPRMNGQNLAAELQKRHPELKVLFVSGYTDHSRLGTNAVPEDRLLHKPFTRSQLLSRVHELLTSESQTIEPTAT
jgi:signal transduction histidine kinase